MVTYILTERVKTTSIERGSARVVGKIKTLIVWSNQINPHAIQIQIIVLLNTPAVVIERSFIYTNNKEIEIQAQ